MKKRTVKILCGVAAIVVIAVIVCIVFFANYNTHEVPGLLPDANTHEVSGLLPDEDKVKEKLDEYQAEWYMEIVDVLYDNKIVTQNKTVISEFVLSNSRSFRGVEYINIKLFSDGTGEMIRKETNIEIGLEALKAEIIYDKRITLSEWQVAQISGIVETKSFWDIPSKHPEERDGLDGNTIFIEGISGEKYNMISMWHPDEEYEIRKIYDEIMACADSWGLKTE